MDLVRSTLKMVIALTLSYYAPVYATPVLCQTDIEINDIGAKVRVDGRLVVGNPIVVRCKSNPQTVTITSSDGQTFTRILPAASDFDNQDRLWNVYFRPQENAGANPKMTDATTAQVDVAKLDATHAQLDSSVKRDNQIMKELKAIRALLEDFIKQHPEMHKVRPELAATALKGVIETSSDIVGDGAKKLAKQGQSKSLVSNDSMGSDGGKMGAGDSASDVSQARNSKMGSSGDSATGVAKSGQAATGSAIGVAAGAAAGAAALMAQRDSSKTTEVVSFEESTALEVKSTNFERLEQKSKAIVASKDASTEPQGETAKPKSENYALEFEGMEVSPTVVVAVEEKMPERTISSILVDTGMASLSGAYVQLYSLSRKKFDGEQIGRDMNEGYGSEIAGTSLKFCHWQSRTNQSEWTRVLLGPLPNRDIAKQLVKIIGRDTFSVVNPKCARETAQEVKL